MKSVMNFDDSDDSALALARLARANQHERLDSDESLAHYERALMLARSIEPCPHCGMLLDVVPAPGARWIVEQFHEPDCPMG